MRIGYGLPLLAALGISVFAWIGNDRGTPPAEVPIPQAQVPDQPRLAFPPSVTATETLQRPQAHECAGTVTNNPAIQDWRRSIGC